MGLYREGRLWGIDYYDGYKRRRKLVGPSKGEAKKLLAKRRLERAVGRPESCPRVEVLPFDKFAERYMEFVKTNKRGFRNERYRIQQISGFFGNRKLSDLTRWDGEQFKIHMSRSVGSATINRLVGNLKHMGSMAVAWNILPNNRLQV
ncbi:MAG TPA: hypothetical protein VNE63_16675 [Candidatus Acidoferrales bacterium]|nr:hypothetical protein [Candidatus Acidoferrales bacterium]